jgi:hypothetical protein
MQFNITASELNDEEGDKILVFIFINIYRYRSGRKIGKLSPLGFKNNVWWCVHYLFVMHFLLRIFMLSLWFSVKNV